MKVLKKLLFLATLAAVLFYSHEFFFLRRLALAKIPVPEILDEFDFVWTGKSFLQTGVPTGWSDLGAYNSSKLGVAYGSLAGFSMKQNGEKISLFNYINYHFPVISIRKIDYGLGDRYIRFVTPYFDHPLLAAVVYGLNTNADSIESVAPREFRVTSISLAVLTGVLVFLVGSQFLNVGVGFLAFLVYSLTPTFVFTARLALAENVMAPLYLLSLLFLGVYQHKKKRFFVILSGIFAGLTALTKLPGWFIIATIVYWLWRMQDRKGLWIFVMSALPIAFSYPLYGLILAPNLYLRVIANQANRPFSAAMNLLTQISKPTFKDWFIDGWWSGSWMVTFWYASRKLKEKQKAILSLAFFVLLVTTILMSSANYPWYFISASPLLAIFTGIFLWDLLRSPSLGEILIFFIFFFSSSFYWGFNVINVNHNYKCKLIYKVLLSILFGAGLLHDFLKRFGWWRWLWRLFLVILLYKLFLWNFRSIMYLVAHWGNWLK